MRLVLIETLGNQAYVFSSNRLREMMGASELIRQLGAVWAPEACATVQGRLVLATSGKALIEVKETRDARSAGGERCAKGVAGGAWSLRDGRPCRTGRGGECGRLFIEPSRPCTASCRDCAVSSPPPRPIWRGCPLPRTVAQQGRARPAMISTIRHRPRRRSPFPTPTRPLPSGRPATRRRGISSRCLNIPPEKLHQYDRKAAEDRIHDQDFDDFDSTWRAVVHADGNGMGEVFLRFGDCVIASGGSTADDYITAFQGFSQALDKANSNAVKAAVTSTWEEFSRTNALTRAACR